jgi:HK97 family phage prohead protease
MTNTAVEETAAEPTTRTRLVRAFPAELSVGDGRTLDVRIVPYNEFVEVGDPPWAPEVVYREAFLDGVFDHQVRAPNRVVMDVEHEGFKLNKGFESWIGRATHLRSEPDGFYGTFRVFDGALGDKALDLVREDVLGAVSMEFEPLRSVGRPSEGMVRRAKAHLDKVALLRQGAYDGARVLAMREEPITMTEEDLSQPLPENTIRKLRAAGLEVPDQLLPPDAAELLMRAVVDVPWDGSASRWPDADSYCASCLVDNNPVGQAKTKDQCHFPVRDPGSSDVNVNALEAIVSGRGAQATFPGAQEAVAMAKRMLARFTNQTAKAAGA